MANLTKDGNTTTTLTAGFYYWYTGLELYQKIFIATLNIPLSITTSLGNVLIILALRKVSSIYPPSKLLLCSLACTDLCVGLITQPLLTIHMLIPEHSKRWFYLPFITYKTAIMFGFASAFTLTAISVDRLLALLLGLRYRQVVTLRRVRFFVGIVWLLSVVISVMNVFYPFSMVIFLVTARSLCIVISFSCYAKIRHKLRQQEMQVQGHIHQGQQNGGEIPLNIARYKKTVSTVLWIQITFLACYVPIVMVFIAGLTRLRLPEFLFLREISITFVLLNSSLNPFLYCWKNNDVRQAAKSIIRQCC